MKYFWIFSKPERFVFPPPFRNGNIFPLELPNYSNRKPPTRQRDPSFLIMETRVACTTRVFPSFLFRKKKKKRKKERKEEKKAITLLHCIPDSKSNLGKVSARGEGGEENQRPLFRIFGLEFQTVFRVTSQKKEREREEKKKTGSFHGRNVRYRWPWREKRVPVSRSQLFDILYDCSTSFLPVPPPFIRIIAYRKVSYRYFENL